MFIRRPFAQIVHLHRQMTGLDPAPQDALGQKTVEHPREKRDDIDPQHGVEKRLKRKIARTLRSGDID
jgi:hypothetical protein